MGDKRTLLPSELAVEFGPLASGGTREEARRNAKEAVRVYLWDRALRLAMGRPPVCFEGDSS